MCCLSCPSKMRHQHCNSSTRTGRGAQARFCFLQRFAEQHKQTVQWHNTEFCKFSLSQMSMLTSSKYCLFNSACTYRYSTARHTHQTPGPNASPSRGACKSDRPHVNRALAERHTLVATLSELDATLSELDAATHKLRSTSYIVHLVWNDPMTSSQVVIASAQALTALDCSWACCTE
jgi:hypothetical protein